METKLLIIKKTVEINGLKVAGEPGGEFFRLPFQKDEDFCDFFHFNFPKTSKFISRRINRFKTDFMRLKKKSSRISDWRSRTT